MSLDLSNNWYQGFRFSLKNCNYSAVSLQPPRSQALALIVSHKYLSI